MRVAEKVPNFSELSCAGCGRVLGRERDGRLKIEVRTRLVAVTKSGQAEIDCPTCKSVVRLPLYYAGNKES
jgi:phage FluMu protein Com